jgi:hypothetical protein
MHDPLRQLQQLRQIFASDKMPTGFLLAAGCSCAIRVPDGKGGTKALIPDIAGVTSEVRSKLAASDETKTGIATILSQLEGRIAGDPNIEQILTQVRSLKQVVGKSGIDGMKAADLDKLDEAACGHIANLVSAELPNEDTPFHGLAKWISAISRKHPVEIFTTNYDLSIEQALEACRVPYFDGFVGARRAFFDINAIEQDKLPIRWARLWKLHGSISWFHSEGDRVFRAPPTASGEPRLIHPSHLKYEESRRMPYLAMIDRLRLFLKHEPAAILVCGYSFSDEHLNEVLLQGLEGNPSAGCFAVLFGKLKSYTQACKLAKLRPNLNVLADDGAIIGGQEGPWVNAASSYPALLGTAFKFETKPADSSKKDSSVGDASSDPTCTLGDFNGLGRFLSEIAGIQTTPGDTNGT